MTLRIALATCSACPHWEKDDQPLEAALKARGVQLHKPVWDDPDVAWEDFDACLIRTTWDYMEKREAYVLWAQATAAKTRLFNPAPIVAWNTHKGYLREFAQRGIPTIPTQWLSQGSSVDMESLMKQAGWNKGFIKPMIGATARKTLRFDCDAQGLAQAGHFLAQNLSQEGFMLQPYLDKVETQGELSALFIDGELSHMVQKIPVPGDYRVQDDFGASDAPVVLSKDEQDLARRVMDELSAILSGWPTVVPQPLLYARVDFLRDGKGQLCMNELELVEPSLFFRHAPEAAQTLADALCRRALR
jgi:glutathione synthase/RimK-type ligase-like ATP-grasp enzyme